MYTLVDFITHVKGIEYVLSILFIAGFLVFWEILKPRPFSTVVTTGKEDIEHLKQTGYRETLKNAGKIAAAPFIGLAYVVLLPIGFFIVLLSEATTMLVKAGASLLGRNVSFEWRPMEAYLAGRKQKKNGTRTGDK
jgi:hypothetical protein